MSIRRPLRGSPLLVSAAGAIVTMACGGPARRHPPGNLMPPMARFCVTVTPKAPVTVNGHAVDDTGCTSVNRGSKIVIDATLDGYQPFHEELPTSDTGRHDIVLVPTKTEPTKTE